MSEYRCDICKEMNHIDDLHNDLVKVNGTEKLLCEDCYESLQEEK